MKKALLLLSSFLLGFYLVTPTSHACTVFGATGSDYVQGGGTLISKVRNEIKLWQTVKTVYPKQGYAYTGLFNGKKEIFNMGINEKGLVVFRTTAGSVPKDERKKAKRFLSSEGLRGQEFLIQNCATVDEALKHTEIFQEPTNYMMADRNKIAYVEVHSKDNYSITVKTKGYLAHTNHYINSDLLSYNQKIGKSSLTRLNRIQELLSNHKTCFTMNDFIAFTEDRNAGRYNSIFRIGNPEAEGYKTLSTMVIHIPEKGIPLLYLKWKDNPKNPQSWQIIQHPVTFKKN